jgi:hypothetical protein
VVAVAVPPLHLMLTVAPASARPEAAVPLRLSGAGAGGLAGVLPEPPHPDSHAATATPAAIAAVPVCRIVRAGFFPGRAPARHPLRTMMNLPKFDGFAVPRLLRAAVDLPPGAARTRPLDRLSRTRASFK